MRDGNVAVCKQWWWSRMTRRATSVPGHLHISGRLVYLLWIDRMERFDFTQSWKRPPPWFELHHHHVQP